MPITTRTITGHPWPGTPLDWPAVRFSFGDLAPAAGAGPAVPDVPYTTARPAGGPAIDVTATEATRPARCSAPAQPAPPR